MPSKKAWKLLINCAVIFMHQATLQATSIVFQSKAELQKALEPLTVEEVVDRIATSTASVALNFEYNEGLAAAKLTPLRNPGTRNLLKTELYRTETVTVFYPETPRVPHHLTIVLNRRDIRGVSSVSQEENSELFATIKKITEIYNSLSIQGFVIAQFDTPQKGHDGRYVVEIIPHLPGFNGIKNIVDKVDCNCYALFRSANLSPVKYEMKEEEILRHAQFWKVAFQKEHAPLSESDSRIIFPYTRKEAYKLEAEQLLYHQLLEILEDRGGKVVEATPFEAVMPTEVPEKVTFETVKECAFCKESVIKNQLVYEYEEASIFYNMRKAAKSGSCFLVLPKRHTEKVYGLTPGEVQSISFLRKALVEVLKETNPDCVVTIYTQDDPSVGQTVIHSHEQVVAVDPDTIDLTWTMMSLYPSGNVTSEEMSQVREEFGLKLKRKIENDEELKEAI